MSPPSIVVIMADQLDPHFTGAHPPRRAASQEYMRNHMDSTVAAEWTRFPPFEAGSRERIRP